MIATIDLERGDSFAPGERVRGQLSWQLEEPPERARLRLLYVVRGGEAEEQIEVVEDLDVSALRVPERGDPYRGQPIAHGVRLAADQARAFELEVPGSPYSFTGRLLEIAWRLELVFVPGGVGAAVDLVVSPTGVAVGPGKPPA